MLADILNSLKSNPIVKNILSTKMEKPSSNEVYTMLATFMKTPIFNRFVQELSYHEYLMISRDFHDYEDSGFYPYHDAVKVIVKNMSRITRGKLSAFSKRELIKWHNQPTHKLYDEIISELKWMKNIRPNEPIKLYRGLLFSDWQMNDPYWNGGKEQHPKSAKPYIDALLEQKSSVSITLPAPSSWTSSLDIANRFARKSAASSEYSAMINWMNNKDKFIDKRLGIILSYNFVPTDILCELAKIDLGFRQHGNEQEFIVNSGTYSIDIEHVYTPTGEIKISDFSNYMKTD